MESEDDPIQLHQPLEILRSISRRLRLEETLATVLDTDALETVAQE